MPQPTNLSAPAKAARLWRTVRHLKVEQIVGRMRFRLSRARIDGSPAPELRTPSQAWQVSAQRNPSMLGSTRFQFLNEVADLNDHGWDDPAQAKLWRYNLHYFDDLCAEDAPARSEWHTQLIAKWIEENPAPIGSAWEPYPTSLRIVNWAKWALSGGPVSDVMRHSLAVQARWLNTRLEWHLLGNHLFANAKALIFAGLFFDGEEAQEWLETGTAILRRELPEQFLPDGGQFELSPMYHAIALEDVLDLVNLARTFGESRLEVDTAPYVPRLLDWLAAMSHPDGGIAFFNDAALGIAPSNAQLSDYAQRLGFASEAARDGLIHLKSSGYVRAAIPSAVLIADTAQVGPSYLPGHAHADTLSFELSLAGHRVIVNSGTSVYGLGAERLRQRGTAAHSTVVVDGENSSEVWSGFRVGRRARCFDVAAVSNDVGIDIGASHDGYAHLSGSPIHRREWHLESGKLTVTDTVSGFGTHTLDTFYRLAPGLKAGMAGGCAVRIADAAGRQIAMIKADGSELEVITTSWHPQFGVNTESLAIVARYAGPIPHKATYTLTWNEPCAS